MNNSSNIRTYRHYAPFYNSLFGRVFHPGRENAIKALNCTGGDHILEVGVGTGLSFDYYPDSTRVTGIDLSPHMLDKARKHQKLYPKLEIDIHEMDAQAMTFTDNSFDKVIALYVASVVPDAQAMMNEIKRACRPDGDIVIVNHFSSNNTSLKWLEKSLQPLQKRIGFRADFPLDDFLLKTGLHVEHIEKTNIMGYWQLIHLKNRPADA